MLDDTVHIEFELDADMDVVTDILGVAKFALEGLIGRPRVKMECWVRIDGFRFSIVRNEAGDLLAKLFLGIIGRERPDEEFTTWTEEPELRPVG